MLRKISFKNYKPFKDWQELELRPITILIGKNSSGKSAMKWGLIKPRYFNIKNHTPIPYRFKNFFVIETVYRFVENRIK